jgi:hypothetical protein
VKTATRAFVRVAALVLLVWAHGATAQLNHDTLPGKRRRANHVSARDVF